MFRREALAHRADRLAGDVVVAIPMSWQAIGYLMLAGVLIAVTFLSLAKYDRIEQASGLIVPDKGVAPIMPSRTGVVTALFAGDNERVKAGDRLAAIRVDEDLGSGGSIAALALQAVEQQDKSLAAQAQASSAADRAQEAQIAASRTGLLAQIAQIEAQIELQEKSVATAQRDLEEVRAVAARGFISRRDIQLREDNVVSRQQQLAQLRQSLEEKRSAFVEADRRTTQVSAQSRSQSAAIGAARAQVAQQAATIKGAGSYVLRSPVDGVVTASAVKVGQVALPQVPLMSVVPARSKLRAELWVPSAAIGFVRPGQRVRLAIEAFAYQRFGTIEGTVDVVARTGVAREGPDGVSSIVYPAIVSLDQSFVTAYGRRHELMPGMALSARILTERRSLIAWLFDPVFAVGRR